MKDSNILDIIWLATVVAAFFCGFIVGRQKEKNEFQKELIDRGFAEYNSTNGVWQLKESGK